MTTTVKFTAAALENIAECGIDDTEIQADVRNLSTGDTTEAKLLARCLNGADADRVEGWRDYVSAVAIAAGATTSTLFTLSVDHQGNTIDVESGTLEGLAEELTSVGYDGPWVRVRSPKDDTTAGWVRANDWKV